MKDIEQYKHLAHSTTIRYRISTPYNSVTIVKYDDDPLEFLGSAEAIDWVKEQVK